MAVTHATQTVQPNDASKDVSANAWNEAHTVTPDTIANILSDHDFVAHDWENAGVAILFANTRTITVSHGVAGVTTYSIQITSDSYSIFRYTNKTATQFTIEVEAPPETDIHFDWRVVKLS